MNIIVVGNTHRQPLVNAHLASYSFVQHNCEDYALPQGWVDRYEVIPNRVGAYRAFRGHQDALGYVHDTSLVFEDDAVPVTYLWPNVALWAFSFLDHFDWISLHGREYNLKEFTKIGDLSGHYGLYTNKGITHINGCCMAYWMKKRTADVFRTAEFDGLPCDWLMWERFNVAIVHPSPFRHDRSQGSLIDIGARK